MGWMIPFWSETAGFLSCITFKAKKFYLFHEFMKSVHVGLVLGSTSGFDHNCIMHSSAHYLKNTAITVSKKDPYTAKDKTL